MGLPKPSKLTLQEAARYVAKRAGAGMDAAKVRMVRAFKDGELLLIGNHGTVVDNWATATVDWDRDAVSWRSPLGDGGYFDEHLEEPRIRRADIDEWIGPLAAASALHDEEPPASLSNEELPLQPIGISNTAWARFRDAVAKRPGFRRESGGISAAARLVATSEADFASVRRDLQRVLKAIGQKNK